MKREGSRKQWCRFVPSESEREWILGHVGVIPDQAIANTLNVSKSWVQIFLRKNGIRRKRGRPWPSSLERMREPESVGVRGRCVCGSENHVPLYYEPLPGQLTAVCGKAAA